ncbi:MAG TPA: histidinol-phosphate transaminase [Terriglobia bacterium]|nr:histidinol-phosphate transaminase [Terriglobia bacterium]
MLISRRNLLRHIAAGAAATAAVPSLAEVALGAGKAGGPIRLSRNENAYGPSAKVTAAMQEAVLNVPNRYPEVEAEALRMKIAALNGVALEQVVLGCGSSEIMRMAVDAFVGSRKKLLVALPTFDLIGGFARGSGAEVVEVALSTDYSHNLGAMLARADDATGLVYICNPNNPTGSLTRRQDIEVFVRSLPATAYVLIDEAYHHYVSPSADYASFIDRPLDDNRVIVARTFSKVYGLAGLRVGYAIAAPPTARLLDSYRLPEEVNIIAAKAAVTALDDTEHVLESVRRNTDDRQEFLNQANARMVRAIDSHTNFVMINAAQSAAEVIEHFKNNNITLPQPFSSFDAHLRVSIGTTAEMREFWRVWDLMPNHPMAHE